MEKKYEASFFGYEGRRERDQQDIYDNDRPWILAVDRV